MQDLPDYIKHKFFRVLYGEEPVDEFEQWVYKTNNLEKILGDKDYLSLISFDFTKKGNRYEIIKLLEQYIDIGEYEMWKLRKLLLMLLNQEGNLPAVLSEFYNLYCNGYYFLDTLGLEYGLAVVVPPDEYSSDCWEELTDEEKSNLIDSLLPKALSEARKVLSWLDEDKIVITSAQDQLGHYVYIDKRTKEEKERKESKRGMYC